MNTMPAIQTLGAGDPLLTAEEVAAKLKVSTDWVWDHSSRRLPYLPVIRMSDAEQAQSKHQRYEQRYVTETRGMSVEVFRSFRNRADNQNCCPTER